MLLKKAYIGRRAIGKLALGALVWSLTPASGEPIGHNGIESTTLYLAPKYAQTGMPITLQSGEFGSTQPAMSDLYVTLDGADVTADVVDGTLMPAAAGELIASATIGGTRYTARGQIDAAIPLIANPLHADRLNGNGALAMIPQYEVKAVTHPVSSIADITAAITAAVDGDEIVFGDFDTSALTSADKTIEIVNPAPNLTIRCANLNGISLWVLRLFNAVNCKIEGFRVTGDVGGSGELTMEHVEARSVGTDGLSTTLRFCTTPLTGEVLQWTLDTDRTVVEQCIIAGNNTSADALHVKNTNGLFLSNSVMGEVSYAEGPSHCDGIQTVGGNLTGYAIRNFVFDEAKTGEEVMQGGLFFGDQLTASDFLIAENMVWHENANAIVVADSTTNVVIRDNTAKRSIYESAGLAGSVLADNNVRGSAGSVLEFSTHGVETNTLVPAALTEVFPDINASPVTWRNFRPAPGYGAVGAGGYYAALDATLPTAPVNGWLINPDGVIQTEPIVSAPSAETGYVIFGAE